MTDDGHPAGRERVAWPQGTAAPARTGRPKFVLHIGANETGTSATQTTPAANASVPAEAG